MIPIRDDNPATIKPRITIAILALCVVAFFWQLSLGADGNRIAVNALGVIPAVLFNYARLAPQLDWVQAELTIFSSMFLHGGWLHLGGNMLYLWIFADNIEDSMGHARFTIFYLLCGAAAVFAQALPDLQSTTPMIGASGAVSGVLGAYMLLFPHARIQVILPLIFVVHMMRLPAILVLAFWFLMQLLHSFLQPPGGAGVAFQAHIGGFVAGMLLIPFFKYRRFRIRNPLR